MEPAEPKPRQQTRELQKRPAQSQPAVPKSPAARQPSAPKSPAPTKPSPAAPPPAASVAQRPVRPPVARPERFVWAFPPEPPADEEATALRTAPAVDTEGNIYLHVGDRLVSLREEGGKAKVAWEYVTGCRVPGPVVVAPDGTLRLHAADGSLHALTPAGKQLWPPAAAGEPLGYATPLVDAAGNTYLSAPTGGLNKIDAEGRLVRPAFFRARQKLDGGAILHGGVVYVGSDDGYVFAVAVDAARGRNLWNHAADHGYAGWYIHSTPALNQEGVLVVAGADEHLYGFVADGGRPLWRTRLPGQLLGSPVIDRSGHVYLGVSQAQRGQEPRGLLVSVDGNSHKVRWDYRAAGPVESTPCIGEDDVVYFGDNAGVVHALDLRGNVQWTARLGSPARSALTIVGPGRLAVGLDDETLVVLDCTSPRLASAGWPKISKTAGQCGLVD